MKTESWTITTERMTVTLVSEPMQMPPGASRARVPDGMPCIPTYLLVARPGGGEPVRIEAEDAALLMWMLSRLVGGRHMHHVPPGYSGDYGAIIG